MMRISSNIDRSGISLTEVLITVAVLGILAAIASTSYQDVLRRSTVVVSQHTVEVLNQGVHEYVQLEGLGLRRVPADDASSDDELAVLRALQWDDPDFPGPGLPYVRQDYDPPVTALTSDYRAIWDGRYFELRRPGQGGAGLKIMFDGSDFGRRVSFPDGFRPLADYPAEVAEEDEEGEAE